MFGFLKKIKVTKQVASIILFTVHGKRLLIDFDAFEVSIWSFQNKMKN